MVEFQLTKIAFFRKLLYLGLFSLGIYFIYQGRVIQRYISRVKNFAKYYEDNTVTEFPTVLTYIDSPVEKQLKYGTDFNISWTVHETHTAFHTSV